MKNYRELFRYLKDHHVIKRAIALILCIVTLFLITPPVIYSEALEAANYTPSEDGNQNTAESSNLANGYSYLKAVYEDTSKREEGVKHFRLEDGSYVAAQYPYPVHTLEDGEWKDIDNTLTEVSGGIYTTPSARIKFSKHITGNTEVFTLHDGNAKLRMSLLGANKKTTGKVISTGDTEGADELGKMMNLEKLTSRLVYENILDGVDLEYIVHSLNVKENIIVKEKRNSYSFSFGMSLNNLTAELLTDGSVALLNNDDSVAYTIPAPVVYDAEGVFAPEGAASFALTSANGNGKYVLTVSVSDEWMNDTARAFPVTVDPTVSIPQNDITSTYIYAHSPNASNSSSDTLKVQDSYISYLKFNLPLVPKSAYITNAQLTLYNKSSEESKLYIGAHEVTSSWSTAHTWNKYASGEGAISSEIIDFLLSESGFMTWDVTALAKKWYSGTPNYGLALKKLTGTNYSNVIYFVSEDYIADEYAQAKPIFLVSYVDMKGVEPHLSYSSQNAGAGGAASVNLATGNLTVAIPTISTTDSIMPYAPTLVYNSSLTHNFYNYANAEVPYQYSYLPYGFKLSVNETIIKRSYVNYVGEEVYYYIYADADGTEHGYYHSTDENESNVYYDDSGLLSKLTENQDGTLSITDDSKNTKTFSRLASTPSISVHAGWYLTSISDKSGNKIIITLESATSGILFRPTKISLIPKNSARIDYLEFSYHSNGRLKMIYNPSSRDAVVFRYGSYTDPDDYYHGGNYLNRIDYALGMPGVTEANWNAFVNDEASTSYIQLLSTAKYRYKSVTTPSSSLSSVVMYEIEDSRSKQKLTYSWSELKVKDVVQYSTDGFLDTNEARGQAVSYTYGTGYTDVKTSGKDDVTSTNDDIVTRYVFDNWGRCNVIYSSYQDGTKILGATSGKYSEQDNIKNNLKESAILGGTSVNYFVNGGFEYSNNPLNYWGKTGSVVSAPSTRTFGSDNNYAKMSVTSNTESTLYQFVALEPGDYTISFNYYSSNASKVNATVEITTLTGEYFEYTKPIPLAANATVGNESFFSTTFNVCEDSSYNQRALKVSVKVNGESNLSTTANFYVDNLMLENSVGASGYSSVQCGSFERSRTNSTGSEFYLDHNLWSSSTAGITLYPNTGDSDSNSIVFGESLKIQASIASDAYATQRIYEIRQSELDKYDSANNSFVSNAVGEYQVSGFAKSEEALPSANHAFRLRVTVTYYQGELENDVKVSYYYDFIPTVKGWQYTAGTFSLQFVSTDENDTNDYSCVKYVDLYCEYSNQANGFALFDNISITKLQNSQSSKYEYYDNGLTKSKESADYAEYYEYDTNRNLKRLADNRGKLIDYAYNSSNLVVSETEYTFTYNGGKDYPISEDNPDSLISKTPVIKNDYVYRADGLCTATYTYLVDSNLNMIDNSYRFESIYEYATASGSKIYGTLIRERDGNGTEIRYYYDQYNARLQATINVNDGNGVCYLYNTRGDLVGVRPATYSTDSTFDTVTYSGYADYSYDERGLLSTITTDNTVYSFTYDAFANTDSVKVGANTVVSYEYNDYNGKIIKTNYANGFSESYSYNTLEKLSTVWYNYADGTSRTAYEYEYTASGQVYKFIDRLASTTTVYSYDELGRMISYAQYSNYNNEFDLSGEVRYNDKNLISFEDFKFRHYLVPETNSLYWANTYYYDSEQKPTGGWFTHPGSQGTYKSIEYDAFDRTVGYSLTGLNLTDSTVFENEVSYTYVNGDVATTNRIGTYTSEVNNGTATYYAFVYDENGNITKITKRVGNGTGSETAYKYDDLGQLVREDNPELGKTFVYTYDKSGNITSKLTYGYTRANVINTNLTCEEYFNYSNSQWGDQLTGYDYSENLTDVFTYDAIGNPTTYYNGTTFNMTWKGGNLVCVYDWRDIVYEYDSNGLILSRTDTETYFVTEYYYNGSLLIAESCESGLFVYFYDDSGLPIGFGYRDSSYYDEGYFDLFWYEKNIFGDIVAIYDENGDKCVSYAYDAWGNTTKSVHNGTGYYDPVARNPFTYRGYYYDSEIMMYYLGTRWYDPHIGRFISSDNINVTTSSPTALTDKNLYAYCDNNPVMRRDDGGQFWDTVFDVVSLGFSIAEVCNNPSDVWAWVGLVGDALDLIPFVTGVGEATDLIRVATKVDDAIDAFDDAYDAAKTIDRTADVVKNSERAGAVRKAWKLEYENVKSGGKGITRQWNDAEIHELLETGKVKGYQGHHMKSVKGYPELAGDPYNIQFLTRSEHLMAHGGNFRNITHGFFRIGD